MKLKKVGLSILLGALCVPFTSAIANDDVKVKVSTGFDYSKGDYGHSQDTEIWYYPITAKATSGNWTAKVTVPYIRIKGPGAVVGGGGGGVIQSGTSNVTTESGLGDIVAGLTYTYDLRQYDALIDLTGKVKLPTANENRGLGTGEADYTAKVDVTKFLGKAYLFAGAGRKFVGSSTQFQLNDIWLANVGTGYQISPKTGIGISYDYREAAGTGKNPSEATAYLTYKLTPDLSLQAYGVAGFSDGSPNKGIGMQIGYKFPAH